MSKIITRHWLGEAGSGMSRRDRRSCEYEAYVPDSLAGRRIVLDGDVAADVVDAEVAIARLDVEASALIETEALARILLRAESDASSRIEGLQVGAGRLLRGPDRRSLSRSRDLSCCARRDQPVGRAFRGSLQPRGCRSGGVRSAGCQHRGGLARAAGVGTRRLRGRPVAACPAGSAAAHGCERGDAHRPQLCGRQRRDCKVARCWSDPSGERRTSQPCLRGASGPHGLHRPGAPVGQPRREHDPRAACSPRSWQERLKRPVRAAACPNRPARAYAHRDAGFDQASNVAPG